ncbi:hypothetical protein AVEN_243612-1 [Araneus ventricosus]|uniref:Ig-like domain-containing protein n=1 Tax=Araneus ventricosus TaxID=182803 RepID=A0A4Y2A4L1_ARAVE|nr:hypothetical protein AVEN_243612-1 [Araneus ventricosus]
MHFIWFGKTAEPNNEVTVSRVTPVLPKRPGTLNDSRYNSSSTEAGVLVAITKHGPTPPVGGYDPDIPGYERYEMRVDHTRSAYTLLVHEARLDDEAEFQCQVWMNTQDSADAPVTDVMLWESLNMCGKYKHGFLELAFVSSL